MESTDRDSVRYATNHVQLRSTGHIVGTDCRQLLVQGGYHFPWKGDVLVPHVAVFGQDFGEQSVGIARVDDHICIRIGAWTIWLLIDKEGRFPKYENVIPSLSSATTRLQISSDDAVYLGRTLPNLPGQDDETPAATLDLDGQVMVRVGAADRRATGVLLVDSTSTGKAVRYAVTRSLLARALDLGFTNLHIVDDQKPAVWTDDNRTYVFMTLGPSAVVAPGKNDIQLRSAAEQSTNQQTKEKPVRQRTPPPQTIPQTQPIDNGQPTGNGRFQSNQPSAPPTPQTE